jgi:acetylornithine deacetylase/succinyl-diaminopimelate desuccinylase-like protein
MKRKTHWALLLIGVMYTANGFTQTLTRQKIYDAAQHHYPVAISELNEWLLLPNNGRNADHIQINLDWCVQAMKKRKFETQILFSDRVPHLYAQREFNAAWPWILFYLQIDGQPVDTANWHQPNPYKATLKRRIGEYWEMVDWNSVKEYDPDWRIFARSVSDSKGPAMAFLSALDILSERKIKPEFNIKIIMDFQEELGSPTLPKLVENNKDLFKSNMVLIMDGTRHVSNLPTLNFGARGIATIQLKVFGARNELHSGQYGNYSPNPAFKLAKLLAGMTDEAGRVIIPGYYDGIHLSDEEKVQINDMPGNDASLINSIGIAVPDKVGSTYEESLQYPSLNVRGMKAASVENEVRTVIPSEAIAELDLRLVPETSGERMVMLIKEYIATQGYHFVNGEPSDEERARYSNLISFEYRIGSKPFRTDLNSSVGAWLSSAMDRTFGKGMYVRQRTTGGSQPIEPFITTLGIPAVSIRIPNPDNNIHAADENLRIGNFTEGIQMCLGILTQKMK